MVSEPICWMHLGHRNAGPNLGTDLIDVAGAKKSRTVSLFARAVNPPLPAAP
jgi:hypothetical protein